MYNIITVLEWLIAKFRCSLLFSKDMLSESENCSIINFNYIYIIMYTFLYHHGS